MLDAACGIGIDLAALARRGFAVAGSDASAAMAEACRRRLGRDGIDVPLATCRWADLPQRFGPDFDAVLCTGNSLAHAPSAADRRAAVAGFAGVLVAGGTVIIDSQDWRSIHERGSHRDDDPLVVTRDGCRATRRFEWRVPVRFGDPIDLVLTLVIGDGALEQVTSHTVTFCPFTAEQLVADLEHAGFADVEVRQDPGDERQAFTARRPT